MIRNHSILNLHGCLLVRLNYKKRKREEELWEIIIKMPRISHVLFTAGFDLSSLSLSDTSRSATLLKNAQKVCFNYSTKKGDEKLTQLAQLMSSVAATESVRRVVQEVHL